MRNRLFLFKLMMAALCMFPVSGAVAQVLSAGRTAERAKAEDFIIFPWGTVPSPDFTAGAWGDMTSPDALMKDLFDCGYNATGFIPAEYVPYAAPYRLATILYDSRVAAHPDVTLQQAEETVKAVLDEIKSPEMRKNVYSIYIKDEPNASLFPRLNLWAEAIRKQGILPYINLFPDYASDGQLGSAGYEAHLDEFVNACHPKYISYDNYSLYGDTLNEDRFYGNLETTRK
ncbi:MAG: hypothetical protein LBJ01_02795, partial [Tannerella sp.]|nr:hypothetical protein [Tannerella sp.]